MRVETVELDSSGNRQVSARKRTSARLADRTAEIREGIRAAVDVVSDSLAERGARAGWQVGSVEVTFGITLAAEAGVLIGKASTEASFEVTLTLDRV